MLSKKEVSSVFEQNKALPTRSLFFLYRTNDCGYPRIGFILSKKKTKSACQRNLIRRLGKEFFRTQQHGMPAIDIVVLTTRHTKAATKLVLKTCLNQFFDSLQK